MKTVDFVTNNWDSIIAVVTVIGGWAWKKAHGQKADDLWDTLLQLGRQALPGLLRDAKLYDDAHVRETISKTIWAGLTRLKVPKNTATLKMVDEAMEHIVGELAAKVMDHNLGEFIKVQGKTAETLKGLPQEVPVIEGLKPEPGAPGAP